LKIPKAKPYTINRKGQTNGKKKRDGKTNNSPQNTTTTTKIEQHEIINTGCEFRIILKYY
jgi:hypothetical protein